MVGSDCVAQTNGFIKPPKHVRHPPGAKGKIPMQFDMNRTWSQAIAMISVNWQYLALIAGIFFLLPNLVLVVVLPDMMGTLLAPGDDPEVMMSQLSAQIVPLMLVVLFGSLFSVVGYAAMVSLLGHERPTVGEALGSAVRAMPTLIGCLLVGIIGYVAIAVVGALVVGMLGAALSFVIGEVASAFIGMVLLVLGLAFVLIRFVLVTPAVMFDGLSNPLVAFGRSWQLTRTAKRRIFGFFALLMIAYLVLSMLLFSIVGLSGNLFVIGLANGLAGAAAGIVLTAVIVSIHQQLSGNVLEAAEAFE